MEIREGEGGIGELIVHLVRLDGEAIIDWESFHDASAAVFGFPAFYGRNMDAWIDCLTYVGDGDGMSRFVLGPDGVLIIEVASSEMFNERAPEVFRAFADCVAAVNQRHVESGELPPLHLLLL